MSASALRSYTFRVLIALALAMSATGGVANLFLVLVGGVYLAAQPRLYRTGLLKLLPAGSRPAVADALDASGAALEAWLGGQLVAMAVVGLLNGLGLWALGVPVALGLGLITALLDFVPIVGPILAAIPAILLGFTVSPQIGLVTLGLFVLVQQVEGHVLQPLIQQRGGPAAGLAAVLAVWRGHPAGTTGYVAGRAADRGAVRAGQAPVCGAGVTYPDPDSRPR